MRFFLLLVLWPAIALAEPMPPIPQLPLPAELSVAVSAKPAPLPTGIAPRSRVPTSNQGSLELHGVTVAEAIGIAYEQFLKSPYVIEPDVMADTRLVSLRWDKDKAGFDPFITRFADELGYSIERKGGISFVKKKAAQDIPPSFVYRPRHRSVAFISELLSPMFNGRFSVNRGVSSPTGNGVPVESAIPPGTAGAVLDRSADLLVFSGPEAEIAKLRDLLLQIDSRAGEVVVRGLVYEVGSGMSEGSAFSLIANILGGTLSLGLDAGSALPSLARIKGASIDIVASMLSSDQRFKVVSSPFMRVRSGTQGSFSVGQDVPVLGAIQRSDDKNSIQSIEYRSSGVIFDLLPTIHDETIDLDIRQELSNFVRTETGVNGSPTLTKRLMKTSVSLKDGDLIVLGGLVDEKDSDKHVGPSFLFDYIRSHTGDKSRSEIVLVLQVQRVEDL